MYAEPMALRSLSRLLDAPVPVNVIWTANGARNGSTIEIYRNFISVACRAEMGVVYLRLSVKDFTY